MMLFNGGYFSARRKPETTASTNCDNAIPQKTKGCLSKILSQYKKPYRCQPRNGGRDGQVYPLTHRVKKEQNMHPIIFINDLIESKSE